jgi:hypothetical protein
MTGHQDVQSGARDGVGSDGGLGKVGLRFGRLHSAGQVAKPSRPVLALLPSIVVEGVHGSFPWPSPVVAIPSNRRKARTVLFARATAARELLLLPRNLLPVAEELARQLLRRLVRKPNGRVRALFHGTSGVRTAHLRADPTRAHRVHGNPVGLQRLRQHDR